jgi:hypothetical protein
MSSCGGNFIPKVGTLVAQLKCFRVLFSRASMQDANVHPDGTNAPTCSPDRRPRSYLQMWLDPADASKGHDYADTVAAVIRLTSTPASYLPVCYDCSNFHGDLICDHQGLRPCSLSSVPLLHGRGQLFLRLKRLGTSENTPQFAATSPANTPRRIAVAPRPL